MKKLLPAITAVGIVLAVLVSALIHHKRNA